MCGINGILQLHAGRDRIVQSELLKTRDYMTLRGPDACGEWVSPSGEIGLGHRRLAIIDLSPSGNQPMSWGDGRYWITYNGEIYNYRELRTALEREGIVFRSQSDTEVILALYARDGLRMLSRLRGMYAFGLWDEQEHRLVLARDPYGIKPLYYAAEGGYLRFASQVKALEASGAVSREVDPAGVAGFLMWGSVPEPYTIRRAVRALPAGHYLVVEAGRPTEPKQHRSIAETAGQPAATCESALMDTVRVHLVADVPVAIFLSAGLDSGLLAALACRHLSEPPDTLTIRFQRFIGTPYDEGPLAAEVARRLGTHHTERLVSRQDFPDLWAKVISSMDQPSVDGFNTYVVSTLAREAGVKVVLSGLGGDELLGGYRSFQEVPRWARWVRRGEWIPGLRRNWGHLARWARPNQPKLNGLLTYGSTAPGAYFLRRGLFLPEELPRIIDPDIAQAGLAAYDPVFDAGKILREQPAGRMTGPNGWTQVHLMESAQYMRNQLLRDADWASMAHSLELRVPFVDLRLRDQLASLQFEPARSQGKAATVQQVAPGLPPALWTRPKSGFFMPVMEWLEEAEPIAEAPQWGHDARRLAQRVLKQFAN